MNKNQLYTDRLAAFERALPLPPEELTYDARAMFGGYGIYAYGRIFGVLVMDEVGLKLAPEDQMKLFAEVPGSRYMQFMPGEKPSKLYVTLPPDCWGEVSRFMPWIERSLAYVQTLPLKKK